MDWNFKNSTQIWIFSVGRGNAAFIRTGLNQGFVLDMNATDFDVADFVEKNFVPKLDAYKKNKIAQAVLSHPHGDHIAQCDRLEKGKPLYPTLLTCPHHKDFKDGSDSNEKLNWDRIKNRASDTAAVESYKGLYKGEERYPPLQTIQFDSKRTIPNIEYGIYYIQPPKCEKLHADDNAYGNSTSIMFYLRHGSNSILFPGDMTPEGMQHILGEREGTQKRYTVFDRQATVDHPEWYLKTFDQPSLKALLRERGLSILVAPHHGLESCYSSDLYAAMKAGKPQLVVISERRKKKDDDGSGSIHPNYSKETGASGLDVEVEGERKSGKRTISTVNGHHILVVFEGSGAPRVYAEKDAARLFAKI
jgi:beta-lactamase superfamily II metal-dependent hydrolase